MASWLCGQWKGARTRPTMCGSKLSMAAFKHLFILNWKKHSNAIAHCLN